MSWLMAGVVHRLEGMSGLCFQLRHACCLALKHYCGSRVSWIAWVLWSWTHLWIYHRIYNGAHHHILHDRVS